MNETTLARASRFTGLPEDDLRALVSQTTVRRYRKNTIVINMGEESDTMYIVRSGRLRVFVDDEQGNEVTIRLIGAGDVFGELAVLSGGTRTANVITTEDCELLAITRPDLMDYLANNPQAAFQVIEALVQRIRDMTGEISTLALLDVYGRVRLTLERLAKEQDGKRITDPMTHQELASMVGSSREMVSRILRDLKSGGYISTRNKRITIEQDLPAGW